MHTSRMATGILIRIIVGSDGKKTIGFMIPTEIHYTLQKRGETQWQQIPQVATVTEMAR
mgnify:CR=1 FL=1